MKLTYIKSLFIGLGMALGLFLCFGFSSFLSPFSSYKHLMSNVGLMNDKLEIATIKQNEQLDDFILKMRSEIDSEELNEAKMANVGLRDTLKEIQQTKDNLLALIDEGIVKMEMYGEINLETGKLDRPDYNSENRAYWFGEEKKGEELYVRIQDYYTQLADIYNSQVREDKYRTPVRTLSNDGLKVWAENSFSGNVLTNIGVLRALKIDVLDETKNTLDLLNTRFGSVHCTIDKVIGIAAAESKTVAAGMDFKAQLFPVLTSLSPIYSSRSGMIERDELGRFFLNVRASGAVIPKGKLEGKQSYSAMMRVEKATGGFETIEIQGEFTVRKPELEISSAAIEALYANCGNDLRIDVPDLGDKYDPVVTASSGEVIPSERTKRKFRIVPTGRACRVSVANEFGGKNTTIGSIDYKIIQPPKPTIEITVNGKSYDGFTLIPKASRVQIRIMPDPDFKAAMPMDAKYGMLSIEVLAQLSLGSPTLVNQMNTDGKDATKPISVPLGTKVRQSRPGTKVYLRLNDIYRSNYADKRIIDKRFSEREKMIDFIVR